MSEIEVDFSEFRWCNANVLDELEQTTEIVEVLGYEQFLKIPVSEEYEKNKQMREDRIKKDIEEAKARELVAKLRPDAEEELLAIARLLVSKEAL